jgi:hypothetical protein
MDEAAIPGATAAGMLRATSSGQASHLIAFADHRRPDSSHQSPKLLCTSAPELLALRRLAALISAALV